MKLKQLLLVVLVSALSAILSVWGYSKFNQGSASLSSPSNTKLPVNYAGFFDKNNEPVAVTDFTKAANAAVPAVVHIKTKIPARKISNELPNSRRNSPFDDFFGDLFNGPQIIPEQRASGSGVIISDDGYIVTNNHVISDGNQGVAEEIMVTLHNRKEYKAHLVARDPSSDLAVLKIDGDSFPFIIYGNSDDLQLGQWVLAVGYPLTLETTVTAGIVSAKGRSIGINSRQSQSPVEYFIQTDAAVNQGNSGGALISTDGKLQGINSAILAPNGTYAGYSFAIPVNIVKKIVNDLIEFGDVKRGYLGISYIPDDEENNKAVKAAGVNDGQGVYVSAVPKEGGAAAAGIKKGDVITEINNRQISSGLELSGNIASFKPGDQIQLSFIRDGKQKEATVTLKEAPGKLETASTSNIISRLGAELETLPAAKAEQYGVDGGVTVKSIDSNGPLSRTRMEKGFVIVSIQGTPVKSVEEMAQLLANIYGPVRLEGFYPGYDGTYTYPLNLGDD